MNKKSVIFSMVLAFIVLGYLYASNKMVIFNHSGKTIEKLSVQSEFLHKDLVDIKDGQVLRFSLFSPLDKKVRISVKFPEQIQSTTFSLRGFFLGEEYNQVELTQEGIKQGTLGIK